MATEGKDGSQRQGWQSKARMAIKGKDGNHARGEAEGSGRMVAAGCREWAAAAAA